MVFTYTDQRKNGKEVLPVRPKVYRNPVVLAQEWKRGLETGVYISQADLAGKMKLSPARVSQILHLLDLPSSLLQSIVNLGDLLLSRVTSERRLRTMFQETDKAVDLTQDK